ncbi:hypothetical protein HanPSC8_Chr09g0393821 [Helianthus annuus]|nr:hypothetical protein HanPSC8_Chr09g0393821 [Helianthus annuus]
MRILHKILVKRSFKCNIYSNIASPICKYGIYKIGCGLLKNFTPYHKQS